MPDQLETTERSPQDWIDLVGQIGEFRPLVSYYETMDTVILLLEDCSYRSDWQAGGAIEFLWHPYEDRLVGVQINCASALANVESFARLIERAKERKREKATWSEERVMLLRIAIKSGKSLREIASNLGLTKNAVASKAYRLGLTEWKLPERADGK